MAVITIVGSGRHLKFTKDFPAGVKFYQIEELDEALKGADLVIGGVSSFGVDWFGEMVLPRVADGTPVLTVTKGLMDREDGSLEPYPYLWQRVLDSLGKNVPLCAVGGPCTSYELVAHDQTEVAFCGRDVSVLEYVKSLMQTDYYHISLSTDIMGIESAVALKNGYALGIALTIGLNQKAFGLDSELHFNSQAAVFGQAAKEMYALLQSQDAGDMSNLWVGVGDLYVTVYGGRTRLIGILLGRGMDIDAAKAELNGVTLESLVVAVRVARAIRIRAQQGKLKPVNIPWEEFTFVRQ